MFHLPLTHRIDANAMHVYVYVVGYAEIMHTQNTQIYDKNRRHPWLHSLLCWTSRATTMCVTRANNLLSPNNFQLDNSDNIAQNFWATIFGTVIKKTTSPYSMPFGEVWELRVRNNAKYASDWNGARYENVRNVNRSPYVHITIPLRIQFRLFWHLRLMVVPCRAFTVFHSKCFNYQEILWHRMMSRRRPTRMA